MLLIQGLYDGDVELMLSLITSNDDNDHKPVAKRFAHSVREFKPRRCNDEALRLINLLLRGLSDPESIVPRIFMPNWRQTPKGQPLLRVHTGSGRHVRTAVQLLNQRALGPGWMTMSVSIL